MFCSLLQCSSTPAVHGFIEHVTNRNVTEILIIGADCSVSTQPVAALAPFWNLVQVRQRLLLRLFINTSQLIINLNDLTLMQPMVTFIRKSFVNPHFMRARVYVAKTSN